MALCTTEEAPVVLVDFGSAISNWSVPEVVPDSVGLNDCGSAFHWVAEHTGHMGVDPARIVMADNSGGGKLTLAADRRLLGDGQIGKVKGLSALRPSLAGQWPQDR
jgi:acetyl esterase